MNITKIQILFLVLRLESGNEVLRPNTVSSGDKDKEHLIREDKEDRRYVKIKIIYLNDY